ncbi:hypothetical protein LC605_24495 [Nostoc sp. CHAB 5836]|uniref:hypothetical protein n=1 Tax=Nostoc sp. CHAB 5836 TaxID=2780404 RepID=UPI001E5DF8D9|nr:hypothetical protein [Nostoc sp. CHAB 5836]MCC5618186.1 hypothetical protein [Nostoc sp. CHAB 5836]
MAASDANSNKVQIIIEAKDVASDVLKKTGISFGNLNKETTGLSKSLVGAGQALQVVVNYADKTLVKLTDTSLAIVGLGVAVTGALGGAVSSLAGLTAVVGKIKEGIDSPIGQTFIGKIQEAAEDATQELAPLSILLKEVSTVGASFGTGFTQKLFNLDSRTIAQQLDDGITLGIGQIGDKIRNPLKDALGTFGNEGLLVVGRVAQRLDRELSKGILDATFALALGKGTAQDIIKNIATNPAIAQYSPTFIRSLLSGSTAGAVDNLLLGISQQIKGSQFSPIADLLGQSRLQNQIQILANLKIDTSSVFTQIDKQLADAVLDQRIAQLLGRNVSTGLIKSLLQNPAIKGILSAGIQDLVNGSFTDALLKVTQQSISAPLGNLFNLANTSVENIAFKSGARLANRLFDGLDPVIKQRNQRSRDILGSTFDGVGEKFTKGLGLGTSSRPILSGARGGAVSALSSGLIQGLVSSFLPAPGLIIDQLINFDTIADSLFKAIGIKGEQIPGLKQLDVILGKVVAAGLGKAIDNRIPVILAPLVDNAANYYITSRFREVGTNAVASAATTFLPGYLKNVVRASLLETGAAGFVFDALLENLKPAKLISNFAGLDGVLANVKTNVNSALTLVDTVVPRIVGSFTNLIDSAISSIGADGSGGFGQIFNGAIDSARSVVTAVNPIFNQIVTSVESNFGNAINFIRQTIGTIAGVVAENLGKIIGDFLAVDFSQFPPGLETIIDNVFGGVFSQLFGRIGQNANRAFLAGFFGAGFERISPAINAIDQSVIKVYNTLSTLPAKIAGPLDAIAILPGAVAGFNEPLKVFGYLQTAVGGFASGISSVIERVAFFGQGLSSLQQFATTGPFKLLIGQNVELQQQLLSTQASLAATSKIYNGFTGAQITDPTTAIKSLQAPISSAIEKLRVESLDLVGVTSKDLIPLYQQIAGTITSIGGNLSDAKDLSLDFGASLGTLNIPLYQSRQEIGSILSGTIDQNSVLAKSLNISNDQVNNWKSQGRLVEELRKKLAPFRVGNALATQTLSGVTSNIQEVFDEIGRKSGEKLLAPLVEQVFS